MWTFYCKLLQKRPLITKAVTSSCLMMIADCLSQNLEISKAKDTLNQYRMRFGENAKPLNLQNGCITNVRYTVDDKSQPNSHQLHYNFRRTGQLGVLGLLYSGPLAHGWFQILEKLVRVKKSRFLNVSFKLALDALVFSPVAIAGYFTFRSVLEGKTVDQVRVKLQRKWKEAVLAAWRVWPLANAINFTFISLPFRVLFNNCIALGWNSYLSHLNSSELEEVVLERAILEHKDLTPEEVVNHLERVTQGLECQCDHCRAVRI